MKSEYDHGETTPSVYRRVLSNPQFGLILAVTFVGMLEAALAPALPAIADALQISDGRVGLLITFFKVPSILVVPVAAIVADRYGRRVVLPRSCCSGWWAPRCSSWKRSSSCSRWRP
ncbi:MFS transporter [Natrialba swarupiae]|nr:MFS transporter [Natrialba swarupiae]